MLKKGDPMCELKLSGNRFVMQRAAVFEFIEVCIIITALIVLLAFLKKILVVTVNGYGKKTEVDEYRLTHRGSKGVMALHITEKNGSMVSLKAVTDADDLIIITDNGIIMRMPMDQISTLKRATQGVRLIHLKDDQRVATVSVIDSTSETDEAEEETVE